MTIQNRADLRDYIQADMAAHGLRGWRPQYRLTQRIAYFQWLLRRTEYWENCRNDLLGRVVGLSLRTRLKFLGERLGFSIPRNVFGPGLSIAHVGTVVVSPGARIGRNCRIHQNVTIGQRAKQYPELGDEVWIGPGAVIFGGLTIGDRAAIGALSLVRSDVPTDVTVAGVPAKVVNDRGSRGMLLGVELSP